MLHCYLNDELNMLKIDNRGNRVISIDASLVSTGDFEQFMCKVQDINLVFFTTLNMYLSAQCTNYPF